MKVPITGNSGRAITLIKAAINGGRTKAEHSSVPVYSDELASAVIECLKVGADAIHLHVRSSSGDESLYAEDLAGTLVAVRSASPNALIGISTGAWILPPMQRFQAVSAWEVLPDFASVNFNEEGAAELSRLLLSRGIKLEAGLSSSDGADVLIKSGLAARCIRVLLEPQEQEMAKALETVNKIETILETGKVEVPRLLHGTEATSWPIMDEAIIRGYGVRIGLEDTLTLPDGSIARGNVELVAEAVRRVRAT
jgi:uncharacterized protein (DUF849 family)